MQAVSPRPAAAAAATACSGTVGSPASASTGGAPRLAAATDSSARSQGRLGQTRRQLVRRQWLERGQQSTVRRRRRRRRSRARARRPAALDRPTRPPPSRLSEVEPSQQPPRTERDGNRRGSAPSTGGEQVRGQARGQLGTGGVVGEVGTQTREARVDLCAHGEREQVVLGHRQPQPDAHRGQRRGSGGGSVIQCPIGRGELVAGDDRGGIVVRGTRGRAGPRPPRAAGPPPRGRRPARRTPPLVGPASAQPADPAAAPAHAHAPARRSSSDATPPRATSVALTASPGRCSGRR